MTTIPQLLLLAAAVGMASNLTGAVQAQRRLELQPGDHVCLIGNALAERMQYFGYFETLLHRQFPDHKLVVRNLGYCGDEVRFRPRSLDFGTPDQHLTMQQADVILAFFGFNESFHGRDGLPTFEKEVTDFVTQTLQQKYNGKSAPRLVLVSPVAHEQTGNRHLPDGVATNPHIDAYSKVLQLVAEKHGVPFVDLFGPSGGLYAESSGNLTFNGVHLSAEGYKALAPVLMRGLIGSSPDWSDDMETVRAEVNEKCFQFFHRYRAVNGYYIYGDRSRRDHGNPPYTDAYVIENERGKLDDMAAVRNARIWKIARGEQVATEIDDSGTRPLYDVPTNFKQPTRILSPDEARQKFVLADGYDINLFASEIDFPDLKNPVQITFDLQGRCWVATMPSYPQYLPPHKPDDKILVLVDTDGDGTADQQTVFADGLHLPTGFELGDGGVYVAQEPNLMHIKDTDGDLVGDERRLVLHGFDSGDSHHAIGAFTWGPGGGLYMHEGTFHVTQVETPYGPVRNAHGAVYRYEPTREKFETFVHYNFANPWGSAFSEWGQTFVADASGGANYFGTAFSTRAPQYTGQKDFGPFRFAYQEEMKQWFPKRVRPTSGCEFVSSRHFPPEAQGNFLLNNVIGFQGVLQHTVKAVGSGFEGTEIEPLLYSKDRNFRPVDLEFGGDGALYIIDWFNPLIGHMQHSLRDPNRDHTHGRIWRMTANGRDLIQPPDVDLTDADALVALLEEPEDRVRYRARLQLRERPANDVLLALGRWIAGMEQRDVHYERNLLEALWVQQHHDAVDSTLLKRVLKSPDHRARAAAVRVLCYSRHTIHDALDLLNFRIHDSHPRVRLEVVRACSFFEEPRAAEIALQALHHPTDYYIDYTLRHTIRRLEGYWMPLLGTGQPFAEGNSKAIEYVVGRVATPDLLGMRRSEPVYHELLTRDGIVHSYRMEAVRGLAGLRGTDPVIETLSAIRALDDSSLPHADRVIADMAHMIGMRSAEVLKRHRTEIARLAETTQREITRRVATVALVAADGSADQVWTDASRDIGKLRNVVDAVPLIQNAEVRQALYDRLQALLTKLPEPLEQNLQNQQGTQTKDDPRVAVRRAAVIALASIHGHDLLSFRTMKSMVGDPTYRDVVLRAFQQLDSSKLPAEETRPVVQQLVSFIESLPPTQRTEGEAIDAIQLARDLSTTLPRAEALQLRRQIGELAIDVFVVRPIPHRMRYDRDHLYVQAGKPFEIVLQNTDIMPHNLVLTTPGSREDVGILAEKMGASPDAFQKQFIPESPEVLHATGMLQPGASQKLQLTAPAETGDYQYVCTFPGHWRTMWGTLHVVHDISEIPLEQMQRKSDEETLPQRQFVRKWKQEELEPALAEAGRGRQHARGAALFKEMSCLQCHRMKGQGGNIGPDLIVISQKMAEGKLDAAGLLTAILHPSKEIEPKYRTQVIVTVAGKLLSGVIVEETDSVLKLAANPLDKSARVFTVNKEDIDEREESRVSIMPDGLLNTMTRDEILDLLAWLMAAGEPSHPAFSMRPHPRLDLSEVCGLPGTSR